MFLNGKYWGSYYIQEKLSDDFIEKNYLIKSKDVVLMKDNELEDGPEEEVTKFKEFCKEYIKKDLANKEVYEEVKKFIDVNSFIELYQVKYIFQIMIGQEKMMENGEILGNKLKEMNIAMENGDL